MKAGRERLTDVGEDALVEALTRGLKPGKGVVVGVGDDCAVLRGGREGWYTLLKTDCVVEGVHYDAKAPPGRIGWKAIARSVSDVAAMGGEPRYALITLVMPGGESVARVKAMYKGMEKAAQSFGLSIVGGETSRVPGRGPAMISVAISGEVRKRRCALRSGGVAGDLLYVTGRLGGALAGRHLRFHPRLAEGRWLTEKFSIHAMMDLSDGLAKDLPRLARSSRVGFELELEAVPRSRGCDVKAALNDGEDYELLFAVSPRSAGRLEEAWASRFRDVRLTRIGRLLEDRSAGAGLKGGWDHFGLWVSN